MCIIVVSFPVKAADADAPAAVLVPAERLDAPGFHSNHRRSRLPHHIMPEMPSPVTVAAGDTEIVIVAVGKVFRQWEKRFQAIFGNPDFFLTGGSQGDSVGIGESGGWGFERSLCVG